MQLKSFSGELSSNVIAFYWQGSWLALASLLANDHVNFIHDVHVFIPPKLLFQYKWSWIKEIIAKCAAAAPRRWELAATKNIWVKIRKRLLWWRRSLSTVILLLAAFCWRRIWSSCCEGDVSLLKLSSCFVCCSMFSLHLRYFFAIGADPLIFSSASLRRAESQRYFLCCFVFCLDSVGYSIREERCSCLF